VGNYLKSVLRAFITPPPSSSRLRTPQSNASETESFFSISFYCLSDERLSGEFSYVQ
jgi:hypothetical protein